MRHKKERFVSTFYLLFLTLEVPFLWFQMRSCALTFTDHVEADERLLFEQIRAIDLEVGFTIQGDGEAIALLDQGQELFI